MEKIFNNDSDVIEILNDFDSNTAFSITVEANTDLEKVKELLKKISELPESGFKYYDVRLKALSTEDKVEVLKYVLSEQLCITNIIETLTLLINSSNNYNSEFFDMPSVFFSSIVDYLDICDALEEEVNEVRSKVGYYFLATIKSYVNHPRFEMMESSNCENMPQMYECLLMLLDIFNISFILNTPGLKIANFNEIPNNIKTSVKLVDLWADKQKFVVSTLSELSRMINNELNLEEHKEAE